jgi:hypothetical protein
MKKGASNRSLSSDETDPSITDVTGIGTLVRTHSFVVIRSDTQNNHHSKPTGAKSHLHFRFDKSQGMVDKRFLNL